MNTYEILLLNKPVSSYKAYGESENWMKDNDVWRKCTQVAETAGKAKYDLFLTEFDNYNMTFHEFLLYVSSCKCLHKFKPSDLFVKNDIGLDMFERMKSARRIEFAYIGMRIEAYGKKGVIVGSNSGMNLDVCFEGTAFRSNVHPRDGIKYFNRLGDLITEIG